MDTERCLEEITLYHFLYDKTMSDYNNKEAKMNRWDLIGSMFGLTGTQDMLQFKNIRDRWMKLVSGVEANTRSGCVHDVSGSYAPGFILAGVSMYVAGVVLIAVPYLQSNKSRRHLSHTATA
ncbi:hypothetical protein MRX96_008132 [Rhipicephalus microplus]